jgi:hypothetical protein
MSFARQNRQSPGPRRSNDVTSNLRQVGDRVETLIGELRASPDPESAKKAEEIVSLLMEFYGGALDRMVELCADDSVESLAAAFAGDPLVASILSLHGLHPVPVEDRVRTAIDKVRPFLGAQAATIEFVAVDAEGTAHLRAGAGCSIQQALEQAIFEAVPEVTRVAIAIPVPSAQPTLMQIQPRPPSARVATS